jgi:hypothetical protein
MKHRGPGQKPKQPQSWFGRRFGRAQPPPAPPPRSPAVKVNVWVSPQKRSRPQLAKPAPDAADLGDEFDPVDQFDGFDEFDLKPDERSRADGQGNVRLLVSAKPAKGRAVWSSLLVLLVWLGSGGVVALGGWVGFWLIVNPSRLGWASSLFPGWHPVAFERDDVPKRLADLREQASEQGLILGEPLLLKPSTAPTSSSGSARSEPARDLLIPVFRSQGSCGTLTSPCSTPSALTELRVYRPVDQQPLTMLFPASARLQLRDRLAVNGPTELFVVSPLARTTSAGRGSTRRLPLSQLSQIEGKAPGTGGWFLLSGEQRRGTTAVRYGHVGYYDGQRGRLSLALPWTSPAAQFPRWQQVTKNAATELLVDQTSGLDPWFLVYRVAAAGAPAPDRATWAPPERLELIGLNQAALKLVPYEQALLLARNGLWTPALKQLQRLKRQRAARWSTTADDQMAVVALHAAFTKVEADRDRASSSQRLLAQMIDGRWDQALQQLEAALDDGLDLSSLLESDSNRLQQRINAALTVEPNQMALQTWGGLIVYARQGRDAAIAWLQRQNRASATANAAVPLHRRTQQVLQFLDNTPLAQTAMPNHPSRLVGVATPLTSVRASDWETPADKALPALPAGQVWYRIQVARIHDGQAWQRSPFTALRSSRHTPRFLWHILGLATDPEVQILTWDRQSQSQSLAVTVRAMRLQAGTLALLASGDAMPDDRDRRPNLSLTSTTLEWQAPETSTLAQLQQQQPAATTTLAVNLRRELRQSGRWEDTFAAPSEPLESVTGSLAGSPVDSLAGSPVDSLADSTPDLLEGFSDWSVARIDLTGDNQPDTILNLNADAAAASDQPSGADSPTTDRLESTTLIFSAQGQLIYSELSQQQGQRMVAIATLNGEPVPSLLINRSSAYSLHRWSTTRQRFE